MKKANSIILIAVIIFIKIFLHSFGKHEKTTEINILQIAHNALYFPFILVIYDLIHDLFSKGKDFPKLKFLLVFMLTWTGINLIMEYRNNYLIGSVIGIVLTIAIYPLIAKEENT